MNTIKTGIFWVIDGAVYPYVEERAADRLSEREKLSGKTDSDYEHFTVWNKDLAKKYPRADFATFPRGRVMFDAQKNAHIVYADECIEKGNIEELKNVFSITEYTVERDAHYRCDKCIDNDPPSLLVEDCGDSYRVWVGGIKRTIEKHGRDEFAFKDILNETSVTEDSGNFVCKFLVDEYPSAAFSLFFSENTGVIPIYIIKDNYKGKK